MTGWPRTDEDDAYVMVDHRAAEDDLIFAVSGLLKPEDALTSRFDDGAEQLPRLD
jgi:hypothetical protein